MGMVAAPAPWSGCETGLSCGTHSTGQPGAHASWGRHVRAHLLERPAQPVSRGGGLPAGVREIGQPRGPAGGRQGTGWRRGDCLLGVREIGQPRGPAGGLRGAGWRWGTARRGSAGHGQEAGDCLPWPGSRATLGVGGVQTGGRGLPAGGQRGAGRRRVSPSPPPHPGRRHVLVSLLPLGSSREAGNFKKHQLWAPQEEQPTV